MEKQNPIIEFIEVLKLSLNNNDLIKVLASNKQQKSDELNKVSARIIDIKNGRRVSMVYSYPTKEITKNYLFPEFISEISHLLEKKFTQAELLTANSTWFLNISGNNKGVLRKKTVIQATNVELAHDTKKKRMLSAESSIYFRELGITNEKGEVKPSMFHKFKQINKYIEIVDGIIKDIPFKNTISVVDMGSGKGYLTFAMYDYLSTVLQKETSIRGIELREELVKECARIAALSNFQNLLFEQGTIKNSKLDDTDILIALHACDTATDEAIYKGIIHNAKVIICAPCCHKQIRKELNTKNSLNHIIYHGILKERQAEILTDTIRAMILEAYGYKTKVIEFIETEHTPKNVLIAGIKRKNVGHPDNSILNEVNSLKTLFGIKTHHLEILLGISV